MLYFIEAQGIRAAQTRFTRMGEAVINAEPLMFSLADEVRLIIAKVFESQGRRGGGSWQRDSPDWLARKVRQGLDPRIGFASGALFRSLTERDDASHIEEITATSATVGSSLDYAVPFNEQRPFTKFTKTDREGMRLRVREYILMAYSAGKAPTE